MAPPRKTRDPVSIHDFHATILHHFGLDHNKLSFRFQGLDFRLTGVNPTKVSCLLMTNLPQSPASVGVQLLPHRPADPHG